MPRARVGRDAALGARRASGARCARSSSLALLARALEPAEFGRFTFYLARVRASSTCLVDCGTSTRGACSAARSDPAAFAAAIAAGRRVRAGAALLGALAVALAAGWVDEEARPAGSRSPRSAPLARVPEMSAVVFQRDIAWGRPLLLRALGSARAPARDRRARPRAGARASDPFLLAHSLAPRARQRGAPLRRARATRAPARPRRAPPAAADGCSRAPCRSRPLGLLQQAYFYADNRLRARSRRARRSSGATTRPCASSSGSSFFAAFATDVRAALARARGTRSGELGSAVRAPRATALPRRAAAVAALLWPWSAELLRRRLRPGLRRGRASLRWLLAALVPVVARRGLPDRP